MLLLLINRQQNCFAHALEVVHHLVVPEAEHLIPVGLQRERALDILVLLMAMRAAIQLDDQPVSRAAEVHHVSANCMLPAKADALQSTAS